VTEVEVEATAEELGVWLGGGITGYVLTGGVAELVSVLLVPDAELPVQVLLVEELVALFGLVVATLDDTVTVTVLVEALK
jgi:hypothetical protein